MGELQKNLEKWVEGSSRDMKNSLILWKNSLSIGGRIEWMNESNRSILKLFFFKIKQFFNLNWNEVEMKFVNFEVLRSFWSLWKNELEWSLWMKLKGRIFSEILINLKGMHVKFKKNLQKSVEIEVSRIFLLLLSIQNYYLINFLK